MSFKDFNMNMFPSPSGDYFLTARRTYENPFRVYNRFPSPLGDYFFNLLVVYRRGTY